MPGRLTAFMKFFERLTVYQDLTPRSAAMNMAIDEALLETAKIPSIRFYRWNSPALSFGYFGKVVDVVPYAAERDLVRRWTGGGIVFHGEDLTYSIVIPANDAAFVESSMSIYEKIHRALCHALSAIGRARNYQLQRRCTSGGNQGRAISRSPRRLKTAAPWTGPAATAASRIQCART